MSKSKITLPQTVYVDKDKCINCHACISACPVKYCNDGSGTVVSINSDLCIACGKCIQTCSHQARFYTDDLPALQRAIHRQERIIAVVDPSIAANFQHQFLNLNGWLKSFGVHAVFDISFGAELCVKSYVEYIQKQSPPIIIIQSCAAIVSYIEMYQPELLPYLAPIDSPMIHTIKMIRKYYPQYSDHKIAVLSPCLAKKRELHETNMGDFYIADLSLKQYIKDNNVELSSFPAIDYDDPSDERAVVFPSPGELLRTLKRWIPNMSYLAREIEGTETIYDYLKKLPAILNKEKINTPLLIDCLNCELECTGEPLTLNKNKSVEKIEYWMQQKNKAMQIIHRQDQSNQDININDIVSKHWCEQLYHRSYLDLSDSVQIKNPTLAELQAIFETMHKYSEKDIINCSSCGYGKCENMAKAIYNKLNRPENCHHYLAQKSDIRKNKIQLNEKRLKHILDTTLEGFVQVNKSGYIQMANEAMANILGATPDKIINHPISKFISPLQDIDFGNIINLKNLTKHKLEVTLSKLDGSTIYSLFHINILTDENNQPIGYFALVSDITNLKNTEKELKKFQDHLQQLVEERTQELQKINFQLEEEVTQRRKEQNKIQESEQEIRRIMNTIPHAVLELKNRQIVFANAAVVGVFGWQANELIGKTTQILYLDDNEFDKIGQYFYPVLAKQGIHHGEFNIKKKNGRNIICMISASFVGKETDNERVIAVYEDITERKRAETALHLAKEAAEEANRLKSQFVSNVSHEIRTPLNCIIGFADVILQSEDLNSIHQQAEIILNESETLLNLINDLLDHAKIEAGKLNIDQHGFDLYGLINQIVQTMRIHANKKNLQFYASIEKTVPQYVIGDSLRIHQIIINLLSNALKFTHVGSITLLIESFDKKKDQVTLRFSIIDTGIGISREQQNKIFESFTQADGSTTRKYGGTGLGTTIAKDLVQIMHGQMGVSSEQGKGSTFWFSLQFERCTDLSKVKKFHQKKQKQLGDNRIKKNTQFNILVAEDYTPNQELIKLLLSSAGFQFSIVSNGLEVIDICRQSTFDIILMDVQMPELDGIATALHIRNNMEALKTIPIIALTAHANKAIVEKCFKAGMNDILNKPIRKEELLQVLDKYLKNKPGQATNNGQNTAFDRDTMPLHYNEIIKEFGGNKILLDTVTNQFITNVGGQILIMQDAIKNKQFEILRKEIHKIRGGAANLTAQSLADIAEEIESLAKQKNYINLNNLMKNFVSEYKRLKEYVGSGYKNIGKN